MPNGRLTLSWMGKDQTLLGTPEGGYEWAEQDDLRVNEVRLLHENGLVGRCDSEIKRNLLITGDSREALNSLLKLPEYAERYVGKIRLVYIDPPFNTGQAFTQYDDSLEHSVWLTMMRDRLIMIRDLLAPDGSVWVHLDDAEVAYCRVLMDEIFGRQNFIATVVWQKVYARDNRTAISPSHDTILVYAAIRDNWLYTRNLLQRGEGQIKLYKNPDGDIRGPWQSDNLSAKAGPGRRREQFYTIITPAGHKVDPPPGRCWVYTEERYLEMLADGRIWFGKNGEQTPRVKRFLSEVQDGVVPNSWWPYDEVGHNQEAKRELLSLFPGEVPFATPKPERLLQRIIQIATNPGDIVLDCFAGSGTTAAVAHKMNRHWIAVEKEPGTVAAFTRPRLEKIVRGEDSGGITKDVGWENGGGFQLLTVAPSMYQLSDGRLFLADWVVGASFAAVVRAQLGYAFEEAQPFCGRKGRFRLMVLDGTADETAVQAVLSQLGEEEHVVIVAKGVTNAARRAVAERDPGSRVRKAPRDLLARKVLR